ncbi:MAG TPA: hypothetical protein QF772_08620 [Nitrospinaceae bacterium]|nr:hypothetical protein [Nitrospinaceae bacterium]
MLRILTLTSLLVSIILVYPVTQSHSFDLGEWIPSFGSVKEALTTEAECVEVFDDSSESTSITCTPKNGQQGVEQTQQQTPQRVQRPIPRQTQQQVQPARKTLPSTLISCKEQEHVWNGKKNHELKKIIHQYSIDHDKKRLRSIGKTLPWRKVLEFSDHLIKVKRVNKKKTRVDTLAINRVTGKFDEQRVISNERALKSFGKPGVLKVSGSCEKIEATPKF